MHRFRPVGLVNLPHYRRNLKRRKPSHWLFEEIPNDGDRTGSGARLYDYYKVSDLIKQLPTVTERINFVNPFERPWSRFEKKWRREHHPLLMSPRKAWSIPSTPQYFNVLNFYKYITKSCVLTNNEAHLELENYLKCVTVDENQIKWLNNRVTETLESYGDLLKNSLIDSFLSVLVEDVLMCLATTNPNVQKLRISHTPRCESFWIRGGFKRLYTSHNVYTNETKEIKIRYTADDRRKLGELSFTMRDKLVTQARSETSLRNIFNWENIEKLEAPIFTTLIDLENDVLLSPHVYLLGLDPLILWQCPGYDSDVNETHKYGCVAVKNIMNVKYALNKWDPDSEEERLDLYKDYCISSAVSSLFNWLNGQAHCTGYTQYNDIENPITSQLILFDGKNFWFAIGQLNTIAINIECEGFLNNRSNFIAVDGPYSLYETNDNNLVSKKSKQLNTVVLKRILQMYSNC